MGHNGSRYGLVQPFDIDGTALGLCTRQEAFTLGVEWGMAWTQAQSPAASRFWIHAENAPRIWEMLTAQGRSFSAGPVSSGFVELSIAGLD